MASRNTFLAICVGYITSLEQRRACAQGLSRVSQNPNVNPKGLAVAAWRRLGAGGAGVAERGRVVPAGRGRVLHAGAAAGERGRVGAGAVRVRGGRGRQLRRHRLAPPALRLQALAVRISFPLAYQILLAVQMSRFPPNAH